MAEAVFTVGYGGSNNCPFGYMNILDTAMCQNAAAHLGLVDRTSWDESHNQDTRPKGCFKCCGSGSNGNHAFFNPNTGVPLNVEEWSAPICAQAILCNCVIHNGCLSY